MNVRIRPSKTHGTLKAIASKSAAHRLLICAAFANGETDVCCEEINDDIAATVRCLCALGADIVREGSVFHVKPVKELRRGASLDCGESGSTMRFLVPLTCMLGACASFVMSGRLPERPLSPLREELERGGIEFSPALSNPMVCRGKLSVRDFAIRGDVSSQFISGLLFALAVSGDTGSITVIGKLESEPYVDMTADALRCFGIDVQRTPDGYAIKENHGLISPSKAFVEGDWSSAAFPLCLGAIGKGSVTLCGIDVNSRQGDRAIVSLLERFGAAVELGERSVTVFPAPLRGIEIDASQIPDLVPILATVAAFAEGKTVIYNAQRLRIKESDRLQTTSDMLSALGANIEQSSDGLVINGVHSLRGGRVSSFGDHRIAMSAAVASSRATADVIIENAHAAAKSYPDFWADMRTLGMIIDEE